MSSVPRERLVRLLNRAEGYLLLDLPHRALEILESRPDWPEYPFEFAFLAGETYRALGRYRDALAPLERAAALQPDNLGVAISLGWCYKRTHRLAQAIDALERARKHHPGESLLHYNLACYWSLAGNRAKAVNELRSALVLEPGLHAKIAHEPDFDAIRREPDFERLLVGETPPAV